MNRPALLCLALLSVLALAGCERVMRNMYDQPSLRPGDTSPMFEDRQASRPPPPGSVPNAIGTQAGISGGLQGQADAATRDAAERQQQLPASPGRALVLRGQERYTIYCLPCHGATGQGDGMVVRRGFPAPPSLHDGRLLGAADRHLYEVITRGQGVMYAFADRVEPADRWAIVAYLRALQTSRAMRLAELPPDMRQRIEPRLQAADKPDAPGWRVTPADEGGRP
ncbi:c-type cytochrome [Xylophilus rhododendri]|uniref:C-type cytochrome n=1 Tax=Xylophilus rhododendri TaxID=2697032 RepID=A0A857J2W8_9BURK|nr:cytochrome c [Xylophilus rhododendri]QHI97382.1 c-type cytochrome [Xylophilus rhododendri]